MTTIEGGMISTNNNKIYQILRIMRSHGMLRESSDKNFKFKIQKKYPSLNKDFLFAYPGYNFRSTEINAVYGLNQIKRLDVNNKFRIRNFEFFLENLDKEKYFTKFLIKGSCNYALIIIFNKKYRNLKFRSKFEKELFKKRIEYRRGLAGGGNQVKQAYLKFYNNKFKISGKLKNTEIIHNYGYYIGNYPSLKKNKILNICKILNKI